MDFASLKAKAKQLKSEIDALYLVSKDPRTPWYAKALAALILIIFSYNGLTSVVRHDRKKAWLQPQQLPKRVNLVRLFWE